MDKYLKINKKAALLARNWYRKDNQDYTLFQNISLGQTIEFETTIFFVNLLKILLILKKNSKTITPRNFRKFYYPSPNDLLKTPKPLSVSWKKKLFLYPLYLYWCKIISAGKEAVYFDPYTIYHHLPRHFLKKPYTLITPRAKEYFLNSSVTPRNDIKIINKIINNLKKNKEFIRQCAVKNINFWPLIKNDFYHLLKTKLSQKINEIVLAKKFIRFFNIKKTLLPWDQVGFYKILALTANQMDLETYRYQDGIYGSFKYVESLTSKKALVWGKNGVDFFKSLNVNKKNIIIIGHPGLKRLKKETDRVDKRKVFRSLSIAPEQKVVIYAATAFEGLSAFDNQQLHLLPLKIFCQTAKQMPEIKFIVKLHGPPQKTPEVKYIIESQQTDNIILLDKYNFYQLLACCDILVSRTSTAILEALILKKPSLAIERQKVYRQINPYKSCQGVLFIKNTTELKQKIELLLSDKQLRQELSHKAKKFIKENIVNFTDYVSP